MSFMSDLATALAVILMICGVNIPGLPAEQAMNSAPEIVLPAEPEPTVVPEVTAEPENTVEPEASVEPEVSAVPAATEAPATTEAPAEPQTGFDAAAVSESDAQLLVLGTWNEMILDQDFARPAKFADTPENYIATHVGSYKKALAEAGKFEAPKAFGKSPISAVCVSNVTEEGKTTAVVECDVNLAYEDGSEKSLKNTITFVYAPDESGNPSVLSTVIEGDAEFDALLAATAGKTDNGAIIMAVDTAIENAAK